MSNQISPFQFLMFWTAAIALLSLASPSGAVAADPPAPAPESMLAQASRANADSYLAQRQLQAAQDRKRAQDAENALKAPAPAPTVQPAPPPQATTASVSPLPSPPGCPRPPGLPFWTGGGKDTADLAYGNGRRLTVRVNDVLAGATSAGLTVKSVSPGGPVVTRAGCDYVLLPIAAIPRPLHVTHSHF